MKLTKKTFRSTAQIQREYKKGLAPSFIAFRHNVDESAITDVLLKKRNKVRVPKFIRTYYD